MGASVRAADFSEVKDRGNFNPKHVTEGDYLAKVVKVEDAKSKAGNFQYEFTIKLVKFSQNSYPYYCQLEAKSLWKIRNLMIAGGLNVPKKRMKVDPNRVVGKTIGVTMEDDEYDGKIKSVISAVFPASELEDVSEGASDESSDEDFDGGYDGGTPEVEADSGKKKGKKSKGKKKKGDVEDLDISDL